MEMDDIIMYCNHNIFKRDIYPDKFLEKYISNTLESISDFYGTNNTTLNAASKDTYLLYFSGTTMKDGYILKGKKYRPILL